ncbi:hypothetical protein K443DRAFT_674402 [Laccaria amethystina LaAM-08-1]|jgi:hypothetical protein|uniref:Uncharacterized protein n=1 Tax=Laccaria amethystina LaAM-08-1 TaxID=1095629 RepID=A0A0C9XMV2_9AGAR|nr:hypothetical protein K443DRAFT_674402 [Laccaria amethystina LaAM-08-1]
MNASWSDLQKPLGLYGVGGTANNRGAARDLIEGLVLAGDALRIHSDRKNAVRILLDQNSTNPDASEYPGPICARSGDRSGPLRGRC